MTENAGWSEAEYHKLLETVRQNLDETANLHAKRNCDVRTEVAVRTFLRGFKTTRRKGIVITDENLGRVYRLAKNKPPPKTFPLHELYQWLTELNGKISMEKYKLTVANRRPDA